MKRRNGWATLILTMGLILAFGVGCGPGTPGGAAVGPKVRVENVSARPASALVTIYGMDATTAGDGNGVNEPPPRAA